MFAGHNKQVSQAAWGPEITVYGQTRWCANITDRNIMTVLPSASRARSNSDTLKQPLPSVSITWNAR